MATKYIKLTEKEFLAIQKEIYGSKIFAGSYEDEPQKVAYDAFDAVKKAEKRNGVPELDIG